MCATLQQTLQKRCKVTHDWIWLRLSGKAWKLCKSLAKRNRVLFQIQFFRNFDPSYRSCGKSTSNCPDQHEIPRRMPTKRLSNFNQLNIFEKLSKVWSLVYSQMQNSSFPDSLDWTTRQQQLQLLHRSFEPGQKIVQKTVHCTHRQWQWQVHGYNKVLEFIFMCI